MHLEAQQRYFSYRAILVAIVSRNPFVLVFVGYRTIFARYVTKRGIAQMCLCETKYQGGVIAPSGGSATLPEKVSRDMGYCSDSIAISRKVSNPKVLGDGQKMARFLGTANISLPRVFLAPSETSFGANCFSLPGPKRSFAI